MLEAKSFGTHSSMKEEFGNRRELHNLSSSCNVKVMGILMIGIGSLDGERRKQNFYGYHSGKYHKIEKKKEVLKYKLRRREQYRRELLASGLCSLVEVN